MIGDWQLTSDVSASTDSEIDDSQLDAARTAYLAPMRRSELRDQLDADVFTKRPLVFSAKLLLGLAAIGAATVCGARRRSWRARILAVAVNGGFFAHLLELQHECLHEHAYASRRVNRLVGSVCGAPTLGSFSHYKYAHLRHHAFLGTPENREFFQHKADGLDSVTGFARAAFNPTRYVSVAGNIGRALSGRGPRDVEKQAPARRSQREYVGLGAAVAVAAAALTQRRFRLEILLSWLLPALLVAEPIHFMIELPEHFGLASDTNPDVLENSRTVRASRFARWFTNGNDVHTAHHVHQGVPMENLQSVHDVIAPAIKHTARSYPAFYADVIAGRIVPDNS